MWGEGIGLDDGHTDEEPVMEHQSQHIVNYNYKSKMHNMKSNANHIWKKGCFFPLRCRQTFSLIPAKMKCVKLNSVNIKVALPTAADSFTDEERSTR